MQFKTLHKKLLIIGLATLLLEAVIVYLLYTSINAFYADLSSKIAYMLTEQIKNVLISEPFDFRKIDKYNRYPLRRFLKRFSRQDSKILSILLIDKHNRIVVSSDPKVEGWEYQNPRELQLLRTERPQVVNRTWQGDIEILDVIWPVYQEGELQGYLRTVVSVQHLQNFYKNRKKILYFASVFTFGIILLTVLLTSRIYQSSIKDINIAIEHLSEANYDYRPAMKKGDEFEPVYSGLQKLFEKTADLSESFRESEKRIQAMMRVIHEGLLIIDMNMNIATYNDYLLDILRIRRYSDPHKQIYKIFQLNPRLVEIYRRSRDPMTHAVRKILALRLLDGRTMNVQVHAMPISENGRVSSIIFYFKNLGLLQELEQNLHRSMKYGLISQLASSIGHEIRNPLSSLAIHTEIVSSLVNKSVKDKDRARKIHKSISILNAEIERLQKMIDQFFNLAKSKDIQLSYENINDLVSEVLDLVQQQAFERNVRIQKYFGNHLPLVNISKDQIKQVIINLILNAFDAMPEGGDLYIRTGLKEGRVRISIKDTGIGIPDAIKDRIFDLYFSTKESGGGIGLAISRRIVEAHEGQLYFESREGVGTIFYVELPTT